jgi:lysylphosphatidylglycerol synthetase-like protein (DUF2156 family)
VGYRIAKDQQALLSYSYDGTVMTIDPVSTANPGWKEFLGAYNQFCRDYYKQQGYRSNLIYVGYRIAKDQQALLSYSYDGTVMTIDPVSTANSGWKEFLAAYNQFSTDHGGIPLFNQTFGLTAAIVQKAFGSRLTEFATAREQYDPGDRLLNDYFRNLLSASSAQTSGV